MLRLSVVVTVLCLPCKSYNFIRFPGLNGQALEEAFSLSCRGSGFDFGQYGMHWIRQPAGKTLELMGAIWYDASKTVYASSVQGCI